MILFREVSPLPFKRGRPHPFIGVSFMVTLGDTSKISPFSIWEYVALSLSIERVVTLRLLAQLSPSVTTRVSRVLLRCAREKTGGRTQVPLTGFLPRRPESFFRVRGRGCCNPEA
jgi:hypothetical protein